MFNNTNLIKLIKAAHRRNTLSVTYNGAFYYITDEHLIAMIADIKDNRKVAAAITECLGTIPKDGWAGKRTSESIMRMWQEKETAADQEAIFTKWIYCGKDESWPRTYIFKTLSPNRRLAIKQVFLDVLENPFDCYYRVDQEGCLVVGQVKDFNMASLLIMPCLFEEELPTGLLTA